MISRGPATPLWRLFFTCTISYQGDVSHAYEARLGSRGGTSFPGGGTWDDRHTRARDGGGGVGFNRGHRFLWVHEEVVVSIRLEYRHTPIYRENGLG